MLDAAKVAARREKLGLTQTEAAQRAGFTRQRWNDLESGRKTNVELATLEKVAKALECKVQTLLR